MPFKKPAWVGRIQEKVKSVFSTSSTNRAPQPLGVLDAGKKGRADVRLVGNQVEVTFLDRKDQRPVSFNRHELPPAVREQVNERIQEQEKAVRKEVWKNRREKVQSLANRAVDFLGKKVRSTPRPPVETKLDGVRLAGKDYTYKVRFLPDGSVNFMRPREKHGLLDLQPGPNGKYYVTEKWQWNDLPQYVRQQLSVMSQQQESVQREQERIKEQIRKEAAAREKQRLSERKQIDRMHHANERTKRWEFVKEKAKTGWNQLTERVKKAVAVEKPATRYQKAKRVVEERGRSEWVNVRMPESHLRVIRGEPHETIVARTRLRKNKKGVVVAERVSGFSLPSDKTKKKYRGTPFLRTMAKRRVNQDLAIKRREKDVDREGMPYSELEP